MAEWMAEAPFENNDQYAVVSDVYDYSESEKKHVADWIPSCSPTYPFQVVCEWTIPSIVVSFPLCRCIYIYINIIYILYICKLLIESHISWIIKSSPLTYPLNPCLNMFIGFTLGFCEFTNQVSIWSFPTHIHNFFVACILILAASAWLPIKSFQTCSP